MVFRRSINTALDNDSYDDMVDYEDDMVDYGGDEDDGGEEDEGGEGGEGGKGGEGGAGGAGGRGLQNTTPVTSGGKRPSSTTPSTSTNPSALTPMAALSKRINSGKKTGPSIKRTGPRSKTGGNGGGSDKNNSTSQPPNPQEQLAALLARSSAMAASSAKVQEGIANMTSAQVDPEIARALARAHVEGLVVSKLGDEYKSAVRRLKACKSPAEAKAVNLWVQQACANPSAPADCTGNAADPNLFVKFWGEHSPPIGDKALKQKLHSTDCTCDKCDPLSTSSSSD